ncbi:MAG TPA: hypothetical protein VE219_05260, partial [Candidatus Sulfotelmatobacter sp.]|nr:hypothetical protein [Candidatus Sulfotelmatobacter sp.]
EELKLCVVPQPGMTIAPADLHRFLRERLPTFMVPRYIEVRDELPKTPTTRVQKYRLREAGTASCWDSRKRPQAIFESKPES